MKRAPLSTRASALLLVMWALLVLTAAVFGWVAVVQAATWPAGLKQQLLPAAMQTLPPQQGPEQHWPLQQAWPDWQQ